MDCFGEDKKMTTIEPMLLTPREAAKALSICERTLYALTRRGELPVVRIGRAVRYDVADLRGYIDRMKKQSMEP
jgi:excisionase family DNA binding protein